MLEEDLSSDGNDLIKQSQTYLRVVNIQQFVMS